MFCRLSEADKRLSLAVDELEPLEAAKRQIEMAI